MHKKLNPGRRSRRQTNGTYTSILHVTLRAALVWNLCALYIECCRAKIKAKSMMCAALLDTEFLSAGKVTVGGNQTRLKFMCFYKTSHLIFKISTRVSRNMSTFCLTNPDVCRPQIISPWPMRCLKREPACLISASFCRHISRRNVFKA